MGSDHNIPAGCYSEADFSAPRRECPNPAFWTTRDFQSTEIEVVELVYGLVRGLQPEMCVETGTSRGFLAEMVGSALEANGHGYLVTFEPDVEVWTEAQVRLDAYLQVISVLGPSMSPWDGPAIDFAWFDSHLDLRKAELDFYYPYLAPGAIVCFHDTAPRFGAWSDAVRADERLRTIDLPTPRGVIIASLRS